MEKQMFCYQCQETAFGTGCVFKGVCGKQPATAHLMDLLLFTLKGVGAVASVLNDNHIEIPETTDKVIVDGLFSTITNANFDNIIFPYITTQVPECKDLANLMEGVTPQVKNSADFMAAIRERLEKRLA